MGCHGHGVDLILDDPDPHALVQQVVEFLDGLGQWVGYAPALDDLGEPIYLLQEPIAA